MTFPISVGHLLEMSPTQRARSIQQLPQSSKTRLAHLAILGADRLSKQMDQLHSLAVDLTKGAS